MIHRALPLLLSAAAAAAPAIAAETCRAESPASAPQVVELYTSEGCSSCPPADRWLSGLKGRPDVLALAFHVNYWDKLGWVDRFATPEGTARQYELARDGSTVYTPQVRVDGRDWRAWPRLPAAAARAAPRVTLAREGDQVVAQIEPRPGPAADALAGYWAVLEDRHTSRVRAGENAGETLQHDHVVRLYRPVPAWRADAGTTLRLQVTRGVPDYPRRVAFVVVDGRQQPVQAVTLAC